MHYDYLIIGGGICGTMLSWNLYKEGKTFLVVDKEQADAASRVAAGVINPVTGRRYSYTWMIDELMPFALQAYEELGHYLGSVLIYKRSIIDFFLSAQMRNAFVDRLTENDTLLQAYPDQNSFNTSFNYDFGCGEIGPAYTVHVPLLLALWRKKLEQKASLLPEQFWIDHLQVSKDEVRYGDITAEKVIFCEGIGGAGNPWFRLLPFAASKGEALIIECAGLPDTHIFKRGLMLVPLPQKDTYWVGSNYLWDFENSDPSAEFYQQATTGLSNWLKRPYNVLDHKAAIRPGTLERRPFVGFHPLYPNVGIFNGMGTKGTSLAPFFAHQLVQHEIHNFPIAPQADVKRFSRILSKGPLSGLPNPSGGGAQVE